MNMLFEVENKKTENVSDFKVVEKILRILKSYGPSSFACLTNSEGNYLQVAGGRVTCALEYKVSGEAKHYRAYLSKPKVIYEGKQILSFGGGELILNPDEFLFIDDVVLAFNAFFFERPWPAHIHWRNMTELLSN